MTTLNLDENNSLYQIRSYQPGAIQINNLTLTTSVIISPNKLIEHWAPQEASELTTAALTIVAELKPDVVLIGTGSELILLPPALYGDLINQGIGVEVMTLVVSGGR